MKLGLTVLWICFAAGMAAFAADQSSTPPVEVTFCQLMKNPMAFTGKQIRIRGIYQYGFEVSFLKSPVCCPDRGLNVGIIFAPGMDDRSSKLFRKLDKGMGFALATFVGKLERVHNASSQLPSGDRLELTVDQIEKVEKSERWHNGKNPEWVPANCEGKNNTPPQSGNKQ